MTELAILFLGIYPKGSVALFRRHLCFYVHCSTVHNNPNLDATEVDLIKNGILLYYEKRGKHAIFCQLDGFGKNYIE